jgi:hypothetical protein
VPPFASNEPAVEVTALQGESSGYAVLVNHGAKARRVTLTTPLAPRSVRRIEPDGPRALELGAGIDLEPWEGAVVEWRR